MAWETGRVYCERLSRGRLYVMQWTLKYPDMASVGTDAVIVKGCPNGQNEAIIRQ